MTLGMLSSFISLYLSLGNNYFQDLSINEWRNINTEAYRGNVYKHTNSVSLPSNITTYVHLPKDGIG